MSNVAVHLGVHAERHRDGLIRRTPGPGRHGEPDRLEVEECDRRREPRKSGPQSPSTTRPSTGCGCPARPDVAFLLSQGTSREARATAREMGRLPYSRSSFGAWGTPTTRFVSHHQQVEEAIIEAWSVPEEACSVSASLDRVSIPMEEPLPRPRGRPRKGAAKRPIARVYRMAYCGTVTLHDAQGDGLYTIRYGTMPDGDPRAGGDGE